VVSDTTPPKLRLLLHPQQQHHHGINLGKRGTTQKQLDHGSLQDLWQEHANDWDVETRSFLADSLRPTTLQGYNGILTRFERFCSKNHYTYFPTTTAAVAHFFREISSKVERPGPTLITASAAIAGMYKGSMHHDPTKSQLLTMLKQAIVNTGTKRPRKNTPVFPIEKLTDYITGLGPNQSLDTKTLRAKAICLLALVGLYRPSDLELITLDQLTFTEFSVSITNFGGKTDKDMAGLPTTITRATDPFLCPASTLRDYIDRTAETRARIPKKPVFLYLDSKKAEPLGSQRISKIMTLTLQAAGIDDTTAKSFRKTGASVAINKGADPDLVMKLGRWKTVEVFYKHYVDWNEANLTDAILDN